MKKWVCATVVIGLVSAFVMGCGNPIEQVEKKETLLVLAASSLQPALQKLEQQYENQHPNIDVIFHFGASGTLANQMAKGAPGDVFLSANSYSWTLLNGQRKIFSEVKPICGNELVLVLSSGRKVDSLSDLENLSLKRFGIGEEQNVPVGIYSKQALQKSHVYDLLKPNMIFAQSAAQLTFYVKSKSVDGAILFATDAKQHNIPVAFKIPSTDHEPIFYTAGIVSDSHLKESKTWLDFLQSGEAKKTWKEYGFQ